MLFRSGCLVKIAVSDGALYLNGRKVEPAVSLAMLNAAQLVGLVSDNCVGWGDVAPVDLVAVGDFLRHSQKVCPVCNGAGRGQFVTVCGECSGLGAVPLSSL